MTFYTNSRPEPPHERIGEINGRCPGQPAPTLCLDSAEAGCGNSQSAPAAMHGEMSRGAKFRNHRFPSQKDGNHLTHILRPTCCGSFRQEMLSPEKPLILD